MSVAVSETREQVYNVPYEVYNAPVKGGFSFLFNHLRKFSLDRQQVAYDLLNTGQRFLDIGCGFGQLVVMAKTKFDETYGIDFCTSDIERARKSIEDSPDKGKIFFLNHDVEKGLPFEESFFDAVACVAVLEHIFSPPILLDEIRRVLKTRGKFVVEVPNFAWFPYRLQLLLGRLPVTGGVDELGIDWLHLHNFTELTLRRFLERKGFRVGRISSSGLFARYRRWWLSALSSDIVMETMKSR